MALPVLALVTAACNELGIDGPASLASLGDPNASQFLALANAVGDDLKDAHDWSALVVEGALLTMVSGQERYPLPSDFDRLVRDTQWDRTNKWQLLGPDNPSEARWRRESIASGLGPRRAIRQVGNAVTIWPVPTTSGDLIAFDYVSTSWALSGGSGAASSFASDPDTCLFRDRLIIDGLKWSYSAAKGLEATALELKFEAEKRKAIARDMGGGRVLSMSNRGAWTDRHGNTDDVLPAPIVSLPSS